MGHSEWPIQQAFKGREIIAFLKTNYDSKKRAFVILTVWAGRRGRPFHDERRAVCCRRGFALRHVEENVIADVKCHVWTVSMAA